MSAKVIVGSADQDRLDRSRRIEWLDIPAVEDARVLMVGAGALGNEVAKDLALSGFQRITIVDMDHVVPSNLNRCMFFTEEDASKKRMKADAVAEGIKRLSKKAKPKPLVNRVQELPPKIFSDHDIVLGCLDNVDARIHTNAHAYARKRVYVDGGMEGMVGRVMVSRPPDGACLQCGMNRTHAKIASLRFSCTGKDVVLFEPKLAAEITTTSIISAVMVRETLKVVSGRPDMLLVNSFYYDGRRNVSEELEVPKDPDCPVHSAKPKSYR